MITRILGRPSAAARAATRKMSQIERIEVDSAMRIMAGSLVERAGGT